MSVTVLVMRWDENGSERTLRVRSGSVEVLGRSRSDCVVNDSRVSRQHALIWWKRGKWKIHDLGSRHGTYVNGQRVKRPKTLRVGDRVRLGRIEMTVQDIYDQPERARDVGPDTDRAATDATELVPVETRKMRETAVAATRIDAPVDSRRLAASRQLVQRVRHALARYRPTIRHRQRASVEPTDPGTPTLATDERAAGDPSPDPPAGTDTGRDALTEGAGEASESATEPASNPMNDDVIVQNLGTIFPRQQR